MSGERDAPDVGTVAEEAVKLLGALSGWAREAEHDLGHDLGQGLEDHLATGAAECTYCPICRTVHAVRQLNPEVRAQLAAAGSALLQAASALLATAVADPPASSGVEHIDLDDDGDWPDEPEEDPR